MLLFILLRLEVNINVNFTIYSDFYKIVERKKYGGFKNEEEW